MVFGGVSDIGAMKGNTQKLQQKVVVLEVEELKRDR